ncbi:D-2-hydroxyacid dehydrogenase family protein [Acerihabitans sp.]|uniref:D-2-hydroxyacid dehydrogenase family protein n=1 Tax=Acerihabitans sp. TaxID=2811394 RepID=UPI002ED9CD31
MSPLSPLRIAVIDDWQSVAGRLVDWSALAPVGEVIFLHEFPADTAVLIERLRSYDVICAMRERTRFDRALLMQLPQLKLLVTSGMKNAAIDIAAAGELGISVAGTGGDPYAAPELTWALVMALTRNLLAEGNALKSGGWQQGLGVSLHGRTLGILGLGKIGRKVARYAQAFGMETIAWSENLTAERAAESGVIYVDKQTLFAQSDVLSVHLVLSERSRGIVDAASLARMKPGAYVVNTARGPIIDEAALIDALRKKRIAGAALDVFDQEPLPAGHPFRTLDNVLATPHIGYVTRESYSLFFSHMIEDILAWHAGRPIRLLA